ncbi:hypothetical protein N8762_00715 [Candidatus Marinamargulisbacteria bacterium]|nr:hypothetical protein [bacterium]MDA7563994.1 hypothetical protein [Candidatus Marinamargulisbacteria bacterium]|tara:strand:- start:1475 stop:1888 length:414 start_codon:yes stop_codon:yes gene_type:complete
MQTFLSQTIQSGSSPRKIGSSHFDLVRSGKDQTNQLRLSNDFKSQSQLSTFAQLNPTHAPLMMISEEDYIRIKSRMNRYHVHRYTGNIVYSVHPHKIRRFNPKTFLSDDDTRDDDDEVGIKRTGYWHVNGEYVGPVS